MEYAAVFNVVPDFKFTATQGNRDSIIVEWNELKGIHSYSIRRRAAHTNDDFEVVATCTDTTRWADTSDETIVGEFEYTIMPLNADGTDAWTQFTPVVGYHVPGRPAVSPVKGFIICFTRCDFAEYQQYAEIDKYCN